MNFIKNNRGILTGLAAYFVIGLLIYFWILYLSFNSRNRSEDFSALGPGIIFILYTFPSLTLIPSNGHWGLLSYLLLNTTLIGAALLWIKSIARRMGRH